MFKPAASLLLLGATFVTACGPDTTRERATTTADRPAAATAVSAQRLDPQQVPEDLRHLVPLAERWGIGDDVDRNAKVDAATPAERAELIAALQPPHHQRITEWLNSFGQGQMTDEAGAFMYMQLALDEMTAGNPH